MPRILIDGQEFTPSFEFHTWGGVLQSLDAALAARGRIVTDVRFDGVDHAAFREPGALDRSIHELAIIEIVSGTPRGLMTRCLDEALAAIPPLCEAALAVGQKYRGHDIRAAGGQLAELADGLASLVAIVDAAGSALQIDLAKMRCGEDAAADLVGTLGGHLEGLVSAQEAGDWITVADALQHDVEPSLKRLAPLLESLLTGTAPEQVA